MINYRKIDNKTILLTGATGLVGKAFIEYILERNKTKKTHTKIIALGRSKKKFTDRFKDIKKTKDLVFFEHDVNKSININEKIDLIIHLASNTHPKQYAKEPITTEITNIIGTKNLLDLAAKNKNCKFFFMSSGDIYGENDTGKEYLSEDDAGYINCNTLRACYIEGKRAGEALCVAYEEEKKVKYFIGRSCRLFGPNLQLSDSKAISQFIVNAAKGKDIVLKSKGNQKFSFLYIYDAVLAMLYIICNGKVNNVYNIADKNQIMSLKDLAYTISKIAHVNVNHSILNGYEKKGSSNFTNVCLDSTKLNDLGWKPSLSLEEAIEITINELKNQVILKPYKNKYNNK